MHVQRHDHPELAALASLCSVQTFMNLQDVLGVEYLGRVWLLRKIFVHVFRKKNLVCMEY